MTVCNTMIQLRYMSARRKCRINDFTEKWQITAPCRDHQEGLLNGLVDRLGLELATRHRLQ